MTTAAEDLTLGQCQATLQAAQDNLLEYAAHVETVRAPGLAERMACIQKLEYPNASLYAVLTSPFFPPFAEPDNRNADTKPTPPLCA